MNTYNVDTIIYKYLHTPCNLYIYSLLFIISYILIHRILNLWKSAAYFSKIEY